MITLKDGTQISDYHTQDCCERVYADWDALKDTTFDANLITRENLEIELVETGFRINGYFVPCYNEQNGYYSDDLELTVYYTDGTGDVYSLDSEFVGY